MTRKSAKLLSQVLVLLGFFLPGSCLCGAQDARQQIEATQPPDLHTLLTALQDLRSQMEDLRAEVAELRTQLAAAGLQPQRLGEYNQYNSNDRSPAGLPAGASLAGAAQTKAAPEHPGEDPRIAALKESQELLEQKINEQSQTKVESGSKYRLRLSGIVLTEMFENRGNVDNQDFSSVALPPATLTSPGTFGGSLRQSQIGLEAFGPDVAGAHTSASVKFDFAGGFPSLPNGSAMGIVRFRTGTVRLDWANTSLIAGQDELFLSPLSPASLASLAVPALSYSGNLWSWTPQVRIEHHFALGTKSNLLLQAAILDSLSGDVPQTIYERGPSWGERSGQPAYAGRISWSIPAYGENLTIGAGGYYGRQDWGFSRTIDSWATTFDFIAPLGSRLEFSGQFYRGRALGGLNGAIGQDILFSGSLLNPVSPLRGLDSLGGWTQLKFKARENFEINGAIGIDNPFAAELRSFPATTSFYGSPLSRNLSPLVNFIYQIRSDILFSAEYRYLRTSAAFGGFYSANHTTLSVGYVF